MLGGLRTSPALAPVYEALLRADWPAAIELAGGEAAEDPAALEAVAIAADLAVQDDLTYRALHAAYERFQADGDRLGSARVAIALTVHSATVRGEIAVAIGWLGRARTMLEGIDDVPERGWLAVTDAQKSLIADNDSVEAARLANEAVRIGRQTGDKDLEMFALAVGGAAMVSGGATREGLYQLDEAAAACIAGEVRAPWTASYIMCHVMEGCCGVRDWRRATEWFTQAHMLAERWKVPGFFAQCRPHYAMLLTWRGDWADAEEQLQASIDEVGGPAHRLAGEGIVRLAELRYRQGRLDEAADLFALVEHDPLSLPGRAALALARGDARAALELAQRALRRLPRDSRLHRLPGLEILVRAACAQSDHAAASEAASELREIARYVGTKATEGAANAAAGTIAASTGDLDAARVAFEEAIDCFEGDDAPYEASVVRADLAGVLLGAGREAEARSLAGRAAGRLSELGAGLEARRAAGIAAGRVASPKVAGDAGNLSEREAEVLGLLAGGLSNQEIADRLVLSVRTVQRHVENIYNKTGARGRAAAAVFAIEHGLARGG